MSNTKEELNELKNQYEELNKKCRELTVEELEQVTGGNGDINPTSTKSWFSVVTSVLKESERPKPSVE